MYLHIGNNRIIRTSSLVGIFDLDNATKGADTKNYLRGEEKKKSLTSEGGGIPKSFVIYKSADGYKTALSQLSTAALAGRTEKYERKI